MRSEALTTTPFPASKAWVAGPLPFRKPSGVA
jgi:hypothetical protein